MRSVLVFILTLAACSSAYAQERRGYIEGDAGLSAITGASTTGNATGEVGVRVARNVVIFGNIGRIHDAQSSALQTSLTDTVTALSASNLMVTETAKVPAWYSLGGARVELINRTSLKPYVFGGLGFAHLAPSVRFLYEDGTTLSGNSAVVGDDVTSEVVANGFFTTPASTTGLMLRVGGGVEVPLGKYLMGNVGYSVSRISSDTPLHAQDLTFGVGIRF